MAAKGMGWIDDETIKRNRERLSEISKKGDDVKVVVFGLFRTSACATAAAKASYIGLITGQIPSNIQIMLPGGKTPSFFVYDSSSL